MEFDLTTIRIRNERYGGTSFNQSNGDFFRFNHDVLEIVMKHANNHDMTKEETIFLKDNFPSFLESEINFSFLIKKHLKSPYEEPLVSEGPEFVDLSLGNRCNLNCKFCYTSSNENGQFIDMKDYYYILDQLDENRVYQVAIGGGEPTLHPNFKEIIESMHEQYSIIPNYTTNGILLDPNLIRFSVDHCGAIALSYHKNREVALLDKMRMLSDSGANAVLHVVANKSTLLSFDSIAQKFGEAGVKAIAFLLFKPAGRGKVLENEILSFEDRKILDEKFRRVIEIAQEHEFIVGFDTCFAPYLATFIYSLKGTYDSCTGSRVSAYIDWDLSVRPCSFMQEEKGESLKEKTLQDIWWGNYFNDFRKSLLRANLPNCQKCSDFLYCFGGCPFFPEIVLCNRNAPLL